MQFVLDINAKKFTFDMDVDVRFTAYKRLVAMFKEGSIPEQEVLTFMFYALAPGDLAVDGGANVGLFTLFMAKLVGPKGQVLAFEPSGDNFEQLEKNIDFNGFNNVTLFRRALWSSIGKSALYCADDSGVNSLRPAPVHARQTEVETWTLDSFSETPKLIKLDCEGAEQDILAGGKEMLARGVKYVVSELCDDLLGQFGHSQWTLRGLMQELGYDCWLLRPTGQLPIYVPHKASVFSERANCNVLFATEETVAALWKSINADEIS